MASSGRRLGVIGAGNIGGAIAANLLADGHAVVVHDADPACCAALVRAGAVGADTPAAVAERSEITFTSLPSPAIMEAVAHGWLSGAARDAVLVDLSTNAPATIRSVGQRFAAAGRHLLEAPLTGGAQGGHQPAHDDRGDPRGRRGQLLHRADGRGDQRARSPDAVRARAGGQGRRAAARGGARGGRAGAGGGGGGAGAGRGGGRRARRAGLHRPGRADRAAGGGGAQAAARVKRENTPRRGTSTESTALPGLTAVPP